MKRKREEVVSTEKEQQEEIETQPSLKKRKLNGNGVVLEIQTNPFKKFLMYSSSDEHKQYQMKESLQAIMESSLGQSLGISENSAALIVIMSIGFWLNCSNKRCKQKVSFFSKYCYSAPQICIECNTSNYYWYCEVHHEELAIGVCDGPVCDDCNLQVCYPLHRPCTNWRSCHRGTCWKCNDTISGHCKRCRKE